MAKADKKPEEKNPAAEKKPKVERKIVKEGPAGNKNKKAKKNLETYKIWMTLFVSMSRSSRSRRRFSVGRRLVVDEGQMGSGGGEERGTMWKFSKNVGVNLLNEQKLEQQVT